MLVAAHPFSVDTLVVPMVVPECYALDMTVHKISISLDDQAYRAARAAAKRDGLSLSAWLSRAAMHAAVIEDGLQAVAEFEAEYGPIPEEDRREAEALFEKWGMGRTRR
jgi:hypothetical protein